MGLILDDLPLDVLDILFEVADLFFRIHDLVLVRLEFLLRDFQFLLKGFVIFLVLCAPELHLLVHALNVIGEVFERFTQGVGILSQRLDHVAQGFEVVFAHQLRDHLSVLFVDLFILLLLAETAHANFALFLLGLGLLWLLLLNWFVLFERVSDEFSVLLRVQVHFLAFFHYKVIFFVLIIAI